MFGEIAKNRLSFVFVFVIVFVFVLVFSSSTCMSKDVNHMSFVVTYALLLVADAIKLQTASKLQGQTILGKIQFMKFISRKTSKFQTQRN